MSSRTRSADNPAAQQRAHTLSRWQQRSARSTKAIEQTQQYCVSHPKANCESKCNKRCKQKLKVRSGTDRRWTETHNPAPAQRTNCINPQYDSPQTERAQPHSTCARPAENALTEQQTCSDMNKRTARTDPWLAKHAKNALQQQTSYKNIKKHMPHTTAAGARHRQSICGHKMGCYG